MHNTSLTIYNIQYLLNQTKTWNPLLHDLASPDWLLGTCHMGSGCRINSSTTGWWLTYPSEKWWSSSDWIIIPTIGEHKTCSKPPTRSLSSHEWGINIPMGFCGPIRGDSSPSVIGGQSKSERFGQAMIFSNSNPLSLTNPPVIQCRLGTPIIYIYIYSCANFLGEFTFFHLHFPFASPLEGG